MNRTVEILGVDLTVEFNAAPYRPATYWEPAEGGIQIECVELDGTDVTQLLSQWTLDRIHEELCKVDFISEAAADRADYEHDRRRDEALCH